MNAKAEKVVSLKKWKQDRDWNKFYREFCEVHAFELLFLAFCSFFIAILFFVIAFSMILAWPIVFFVKFFPTKDAIVPPKLTPEMIAILNKNVVRLKRPSKFVQKWKLLD